MRRSFALTLTVMVIGCGGSGGNDVVETCSPRPSISSTPPTIAVVGQQYRYVINAVHQCGFVLTCDDVNALRLPALALLNNPPPFITWTPSASQVNTDAPFAIATVPDDCGNRVTQTWIVHVSPAPVFNVGVVVSGLSGTVVLRNNGADDVSISANGGFTFATPVATGSPYDITVLSQPASEACSISDGTGTIAATDVTATVNCAANTYAVGGTVSGLEGVVVLQDNGGDNVDVSADGSFAFANALLSGSPYNVAVLTQPATQMCTVASASGTIIGTNITDVAVSCTSQFPSSSLALFAGDPTNAGSLDGAGTAARFWAPVAVATDGAGNIYVADTNNETIRKITPAGIVSTLAGTQGIIGSQDGTGGSASFHSPRGIATDSANNVYVADSNNFTVRKITPAGLVSTFAGSGHQGSADGAGSTATFASPFGIATDGADNVYVADATNYIIRKITPAGTVSTLAGAPGLTGSADGSSEARFGFPVGVATDGAGNVYVADMNNNTIRKVTPAGVVSTLAGTAGTVGNADGVGPAASFNQPAGLATDSVGNVYVVDATNYAIRKITPAGVVSTIAGVAGQFGFVPGALPGKLEFLNGAVVSGNSLYITLENGIAAVLNRP